MRRFNGYEWSIIGVVVFILVAVVFTVWHDTTLKMRCREAGGVPIRFTRDSDIICMNKGTPIDVWREP